MIHDQHCHSMYSFDSKEKLENYFKIADSYQVKYLVTTEHIEFNCVYNNQDWKVDYDALKEDFKKCHLKYPHITPLLGVEIGYRYDALDRMTSLIKSQPFDVVNMSIHDNGVYDYYDQPTFIKVGILKMLDIYFDNIIDALDHFTDFNVLSHFDYGFKTAYLIDNNLTINLFEPKIKTIFKKLINLNKALEINFKVQSLLNLDHLKLFLKWYKELGGSKLTLSSDAHKMEALNDYYMSQAKYLQIIKDAGFNYLCYYIKRKEYHYDI